MTPGVFSFLSSLYCAKPEEAKEYAAHPTNGPIAILSICGILFEAFCFLRRVVMKGALKDIQVGKFIWYSGQRAMSQWSCPAVITRVDVDAKEFYVKSLDDMAEQPQAYTFDVNEHSPVSRMNMRETTLEQVGLYLDAQEEALLEKVAMSRRVKRTTTRTLRSFREERNKLFPDRLQK